MDRIAGFFTGLTGFSWVNSDRVELTQAVPVNPRKNPEILSTLHPREDVGQPGVREFFGDAVRLEPRGRLPKSTASSGWSWLKQEKTTVFLARRGVDVPLQALARRPPSSCMHRRVDRPDGHVIRLEVVRRARRDAPTLTAPIMRSEPMAMMRSTSLNRKRGLAELARPRRRSSPGRCCPVKPRSCGRRGSIASPDVDGPDRPDRCRLDLVALEEVAALLVAGEVDARGCRGPCSARAIEKSTALPRPPPASSTVSPSGISVGVPVGPMTTTGSPGFSSAQSRELPPISSTISESKPRFAIDPGAGQRDALHRQSRAVDRRRVRLVSSAADRTGRAGSSAPRAARGR